MHKKTSPVLIGCLGLIGFVVFSSVVISVVGGDSHKSSNPSSSTLSSSSPSSSSPSASTVPEYSRPQTKAEPGSQWTYHDLDDTMGRKKSIAFVISTNTLDFGFPYKGSQHGRLTIRKSGGTNVMVQIERGQFLCRFDGCTVNVRFDSGPIQRFSAGEPSDHSTTILFVQNEGRFMSQLRKSKVVRIEAEFYQEGSQALEFDSEGFKWQ